MVINHWISVNNLVYGQPVCTGSPATLLQTDAVTPEALYGALHSGYPKFYKMDKLCKWAWAGAEYLCSGDARPYDGYDKSKIVEVAEMDAELVMDKIEGVAIDIAKQVLEGLVNAWFFYQYLLHRRHA